MLHYHHLLAIASLSALAVAAPTATTCDAATLKNATDQYVAAQTAGQVSKLTYLDTTTTYTENAKSATIASGILSKALKIDHVKSTHDTTACSTYTELIVADTAKPYVIGTQLRFTDAKISKVETIVTTTGDWLFDVAGTLKWASKESWDVIPEAKRDTRATIQKAADAYLDIFNDKKVVVPWGTPCARLEGGSYTGNGSPSDRCDVGIPSGVVLGNRRYVIDETLGEVDVFLSFGAGTAGLPDSHEFRVEGGKIRYVHTMTVMK
jgi:hypothetical protein